MTTPIRIGNASGFYGDRFSAVREMLTGGPLDVLTGDYLAELTMLILGRDRMKDPNRGYAKTFLRQMEENLGLVKEQLEGALKARPPADVRWTLARTDRPDAETEQQASALLHVAVKDADPDVAGRALSGAAIELALASYPGFHVTAPPAAASPYGVYRAAFVDAQEVPHVAVLPDGSRRDIAPAIETLVLSEMDDPELPEAFHSGPVRRAPLGKVIGARSGDKGGSANVGVWVRSDEAWRWLVHRLTVTEFKLLLPETAELQVRRYLLPNLRAMNFVVEGILGEGVASQARFDPQAKAVGEWLRSREIDIPEVLL